MIDISGASILVVDDTEANVDILVETLADDYEVSVALDGPSALESVAAETPDLILLDIMMPGMDGYEVCDRLKADAATRDIPVLFISALSETMDKLRAFTRGGVDYVTKPFQPAEVKARVATHLRLRQLQRELEDKNRLLQENYDRLAELEKLRDNLVHMIVHDMRSPLTGVVGMLEVLRMDLEDEGALDAQKADDIDEARTSGQTLNEMISSLLDISRMEAGEMPLSQEQCDLRTIVSDALTSLVSLVKRCTVVFDPPAEPVTAFCDREVVRRIVANLVSNSIKFTPSRGEVRIWFESVDASVKVLVSDTGPGIPPEYQGRIFEKFGQVEGRAEGKKYSTGLGLTFCKLAAERHGGEIDVDSELGKGSTFWFTLPRSAPAQ